MNGIILEDKIIKNLCDSCHLEHICDKPGMTDVICDYTKGWIEGFRFSQELTDKINEK